MISRLTGNLGTGTHFSGYGVNQELIHKAAICRCERSKLSPLSMIHWSVSRLAREGDRV
jgi:hypothetical protein